LWPSVIKLSSRASSQTAIPSILSNNAWILHASEQTAPGLRVVYLRRPKRVQRNVASSLLCPTPHIQASVNLWALQLTAPISHATTPPCPGHRLGLLQSQWPSRAYSQHGISKHAAHTARIGPCSKLKFPRPISRDNAAAAAYFFGSLRR
jgi:hypothetical protein